MLTDDVRGLEPPKQLIFGRLRRVLVVVVRQRVRVIRHFELRGVKFVEERAREALVVVEDDDLESHDVCTELR